ncbi:hypothetical protein [uncultured Cohaesibacter sp.]|uniref:hypothetical protein n=1 Tax=uncultured Cohaesibacter sp. TaxID=1002546 RepID=UPI002AAA81B7|nr:hypothetical protein [uncultured Cohaesibacter sp.]
MSGGGKETTTVQNNEPSVLYKANITKAQDMAAGVADDPSVWEAYSGDRYVGPSANSQTAMDGMANAAQSGVPGLNNAFNQAKGVINSNGLSNSQNNAYNNLRQRAGNTANRQAGQYGAIANNVASTMNGQTGAYDAMKGQATNAANQAQSAYGDLFNQVGQTSGQQAGAYGDLMGEANTAFGNQYDAYNGLGSDMMNSMAQGGQIGANNANLMKALEGGADQIATKVNQIASASGRYGSGTNQDVMAKNIGDYYSNALTGQYNQDVNNMMGASSQRTNQLNAQSGVLANGLNTRANLLNSQTNTALNSINAQAGLAGNSYNAAMGGLSGEQSVLGNQTNSYLSGIGAQQGATDAQTNTMFNGLANQGNLLNSQTGAQQSGNSLALQAGQGLSSLFDASMSPYDYLSQAGQMQEGYDQAAMQAEMDQFAENQAAQKAPSEWLNAMSSGAGQLGTSTSTAYQRGGGMDQALGWASVLGSFM